MTVASNFANFSQFESIPFQKVLHEAQHLEFPENTAENKDNQTESNLFDLIPDELVFEILKYCTPQATAGVNRTFRRISDSVDQYHLYNYYVKSLPRIEFSQLKIDKRPLERNQYLTDLGLITLAQQAKNLTYLELKLPNKKISDLTLDTILNKCNKLKTLIIDGSCQPDKGNTLSLFPFDKSKQLGIKLVDLKILRLQQYIQGSSWFEDKHLDCISEVCPNLTDFRVTHQKGTPNRVTHTALKEKKEYLDKLEFLDIGPFNYKMLFDFSKLKNIKKINLSGVDIDSISIRFLKFPQLETLSLNKLSKRVHLPLSKRLAKMGKTPAVIYFGNGTQPAGNRFTNLSGRLEKKENPKPEAALKVVRPIENSTPNNEELEETEDDPIGSPLFTRLVDILDSCPALTQLSIRPEHGKAPMINSEELTKLKARYPKLTIHAEAHPNQQDFYRPMF